MTPDQLIAELDSLGFHVAAVPFRDDVHYMRRRMPDDRLPTRDELAGRQYSIDLAAGRWNRWGHDRDGVWHPLGELVASLGFIPGESEKSLQAAGENIPDLEFIPGRATTFVAECVSVGFVLDESRAGGNGFGNRFAHFRGQLYLIAEWSRKVIDRRFNARSLPEILAQFGQQPVPRSRKKSDRTVGLSAPSPRPFISMRERPVVMAGRNAQPSLF